MLILDLDLNEVATRLVQEMRDVYPGQGIIGKEHHQPPGRGLFQSPPKSKGWRRAAMASGINQEVGLTSVGHGTLLPVHGALCNGHNL